MQNLIEEDEMDRKSSIGFPFLPHLTKNSDPLCFINEIFKKFSTIVR